MSIPPNRDLHTLNSPEGKSRAAVDHHGAQVLSWTCEGIEQLFLSPAATFGPGQAVRGGIPVIFPQFAAFGPGQRHGFARLRPWEPLPGGDNVFTMVLSDSADTHAQWPHPFRAVMSVALPEEYVLRASLQVTNTGPVSFQFTCALHTYLGVGDIGSVLLHGLEGARYLDSTRSAQMDSQGTTPLRFDGEVDRIYLDTPAELILDEDDRRLRILQNGFRDTVVWNPGEVLAGRMSDLGAGQYRHFVCIEAACVQPPVILPPGGTWNGSQILIR